MVDHLSTYLNDHLAGSSAALEFLDQLRDGDPNLPIVAFAAQLKREIFQDRQQIERLMEDLQMEVSAPRKAAAWVADKLSRIMLRMDDRGNGMLRQLEILEALSVGIAGKQLLWRTLAQLSESRTKLKGPDYATLLARAEDQRNRIEAYRMHTATMTFSRTPIGAVA